MRNRLAWVSAAIHEAAQRRADAVGWAEVVEVLARDYPQHDDLGEPDRVSLVATRFGLDPQAEALLAVVAAPSLDATIALAYERLAGQRLHGHVTTALALELCGLPSAGAEGARALHPLAPLRRGGLLEVRGTDGWLERLLAVPDRVRSYLVGDDVADDSVLALAVDAMGFPGPGVDVLAGAVGAGGALTWVHNPPGAAGLSLAMAALGVHEMESLVVDLRLAPRSDLEGTLRACVREAALRDMGLVVAGAEVLAADGPVALGVLATSVVPVLAVGSVACPLHLLVEAPLSVLAHPLRSEDRAEVWTKALGYVPGPTVTTLRMPPEEILATARHARHLAAARGESVTDEIVRAAARVLSAHPATALGATVSGAASPAVVSSFADLVLPGRVESELVRLVRWVEHREEILARGTLHTLGGKGSGLAALFTGSPGTGKTLAAHVVADELGLELLQIDLSTVVDKYIGETEKNLERVFRDAENRSAVLFFDEADALFGSRSAVQDAHDRYANQEVSYLLQRMEHFDGITVLATNLRGNLDSAFMRRIQFVVNFPDPDEQTRVRLWHAHLGQAGALDPDDPVDVDALAASVELSGGDIRNIVLASAYDAAAAGRPVGHRFVAQAAIREHLKLGRRVPAQLGP